MLQHAWNGHGWLTLQLNAPRLFMLQSLDAIPCIKHCTLLQGLTCLLVNCCWALMVQSGGVPVTPAKPASPGGIRATLRAGPRVKP